MVKTLPPAKANGKATKTKAAPKTTGRKSRVDLPVESTLSVAPLNVGRMTLTLVGTSPLVVHNFDEKSRREMLESQTGNKKQSKEPRCPMEEYLHAIYWVEGAPPKPSIDEATGVKTFDDKEVAKALKAGKFGIPATGFKNAIISACRNTELTMTKMRQTVFVNGTENDDWCIIDSKQLPEMDNRICRLANKTPIERFRPKWNSWKTHVKVAWDLGSMSQQELINLIQAAGFYVGVCEGRPEKSALGWGRFEIQ